MVNTSPAVIELQQVSFTWKEATQPILQIPHFSVARGEHVFIKGPSGCGKSTLLSLLTGINQVQSGQLTILGTELAALSPSQRDKFRADNIGYIFQQFNLLPYLNVLENVLLPCLFSRTRATHVEGDARAKAAQLLTRLHLPQSLHLKSVSELSIGQQQRVAAARALIGAPALVIADEPTSALDFDNRSAFIELLMEQANAANATLVFVSHDPTLERLFDRTVDLRQLNQAGEAS
ncbi:methionine ABC transporter ATP-binding protein [Vibrio sp. 03_296]|uniref:ABC transporter ATP-binding protein n=1 Tax=Vibrio TaxID=662 RepID=UPI000BC8053C|nr:MULTISPECIES: ABC transporter ATP-binding protein [Vibrio]OZT85931.1 methionine ABC transporter ATP-binding protein [Vibrio sp. 03_296]PJO12139.1 ABC transporter ATP-binding protein [Vibrio vulnificus]